jgi:hypothetical protein
MNEFTPTVTLELDVYNYMKDSLEEYEERIDALHDFIRERDPELEEDMRDDGMWDMI